MARKLKTYQTSLGFFEQAIAAPSMKAAMEAWGRRHNLFHQGAAKESHDPNEIAATMAKPGVVLRRPVGSDGPFGETSRLADRSGRHRQAGESYPQVESPQTEDELIAACRQGGGAEGGTRVRTRAEAPSSRTRKGRGRQAERSANAGRWQSPRRRMP